MVFLSATMLVLSTTCIAVARVEFGIAWQPHGLLILAGSAVLSAAMTNLAWRRVPTNALHKLRLAAVFLVLSGSILGFLYLAGSVLGSSLPIPGVVRDTLFYFSITASVAVTLWIMMRPEK